MAKRKFDLHGSAPDKSAVALLIVDVINDLDFPEAKQLLRFVPAMARNLARVKQRVKAAWIPAIYVNDNFGRWRSDFRKLIEHCPKGHARELVDTLRPEDDDYRQALMLMKKLSEGDIGVSARIKFPQARSGGRTRAR